MMKRYKHSKNTTDRVGFYVALTVCMMAVGLAVWSAYSSFGDYRDGSDDSYFSSLSGSKAVPAAQPMTGVTEAASVPAAAPSVKATQPVTQQATQPGTQSATRKKSFIIYETATLPDTNPAMNDGELSSLQAVLRVADSLVYPVKSRSVTKPYSEDVAYSETMKDYRAHPGCDFAAEQGESVYAMCDGTVQNISVSELYGVIIEVQSDGFTTYYCGLDPDLSVEKGDTLSAGDTVGTVAGVPCESADPSHIHIEIRVGTKLIDPLSVINSND